MLAHLNLQVHIKISTIKRIVINSFLYWTAKRLIFLFLILYLLSLFVLVFLAVAKHFI